MKAETVCARAQADFLRSSGPHSVQEIAKSFKKTERRVNKWSKRLKKTNQGVHSRFFFLRTLWEIESKKLVIRVIIQRERLLKNLNSQYQSFEHNGMKIYDQQLVESLQAKEAAHTSIQKRLRLGLTRNCQTLYKRTTVQQTHLILKHAECLWRENVQRSSPQNTRRAEKATALLLEKGDLRHAYEAHTFYTPPHKKCPKK